MKKLILALVVFFTAATAMAQSKVAHVNTQDLLDTMPSRKEAINKLKEFETKGMMELQEMEKAFQESMASFEAKKKDLTPFLLKVEEDKLNEMYQRIEKRQQSLQQELQMYSQELNKPILERVEKAIGIVADLKKLSYVIDESTTLYRKGGMDITKEVMVELLRLDAESMKK